MKELSKRQHSREDRRRRILVAARRLIHEEGASGLSMRSLAINAGISAVTVYAIFGSKAGLMAAVFEEDRAKFAEILAKEDFKYDIRSPFHLLSLACDFYRTDEDFYRAIFAQYFSTNGIDIRQLLDPARHTLWRHIILGMRKNRLLSTTIDADVLASQFENVFLAAHIRWSAGETGVDWLQNQIGIGFAMLMKAIAKPIHQDFLMEQMVTYYENLGTTIPPG